MTQYIKSIMKALYNLSDEDNYNVYDATDIAEYLGLEKKIVDEVMVILIEGGFVSECMTYDDDGVQTYVLTDKAIDMVEESAS